MVTTRKGITNVIASMHLADVGLRRAAVLLGRGPDPARTPGLVYADMLTAARLGPSILPRLRPGRVGLFALWRDDAALDRFLANDALAEAVAGGRSIRLRPVRVRGSWTGLPELTRLPELAGLSELAALTGLPGVVGRVPVEADADDPVAVLTYGRLKLHRVAAFLAASARAEAEAVDHPGLISGTGLARLPRLVSTFSVWRSAADMRDYAHHGDGHPAALRAVAERDFHHESIFIRFRPYASVGDWAIE